ncbi:protein artichoke-like [Chironomus tepperi]|uniref:protein artichoke-like n=1 Tax=Chironomus tepperi TaxID=113505 RepID=UPI00391FB6BC
MSISCIFNKSTFIFGYSQVYNCQIERQDFTDVQKVNVISGVHENGSTKHDVHSITFSKCIMPKFVSGIPEIFMNLQRLCVRDSKLREIKADDFLGMSHLRILWLDFNEIVELPENLFKNVEHLEDVSFYSNRIAKIDPKIFENLKNLKKFDLRGNEKFNEIFEASKNENFDEFLAKIFNNSQQNGLIDDIKAFIHNNDFKDFKLTINDVEIDVHRFLLEARSPVLGELIRNNPDVNSLNLDHQISAENFKFIVDFLYEDKLPSDDANMLEIFDAAGLWQLKNLMNFAGLKLMDRTTPEEALEIFILNDKFKVNDELKKSAFEKIKKSLPGIHLSESLLHDSDKLRKLMAAKRKFDEIIETDMRKIEELSKEVEKKHNEKSEWIKKILNSDNFM